jgi:hypothetical protein
MLLISGRILPVNGLLTTIDIHPGMVVHLIWNLQGEVLQLADL